MRLWSIHPKYLDKQGLGALWREALLAQAVLLNRTVGYKNHPQLQRFKACVDPIAAIGLYLNGIYNEACLRGYKYDANKITSPIGHKLVPVTNGQIIFEASHLLNKLKVRSPGKHTDLLNSHLHDPDLHPIFFLILGKIERWERV